MSEVLHKAMVLVLNRNWQAIDVKTPAQAFCMMAGDVATASISEPTAICRPTRWIGQRLDVRASDHAVRTVRRGNSCADRHRAWRATPVCRSADRKSPRAISGSATARPANTRAGGCSRARATSITCCRAPAGDEARGRTACWLTAASILVRPTACPRKSDCGCVDHPWRRAKCPSPR